MLSGVAVCGLEFLLACGEKTIGPSLHLKNQFGMLTSYTNVVSGKLCLRFKAVIVNRMKKTLRPHIFTSWPTILSV